MRTRLCFKYCLVLFVLFLCPVVQGWAQQMKAVLPYRIVANKMIVDVNINGKVYPLVFDTGGTMGIIDRVSDELELESEGNITIVDVTGASFSYPKVHVKELKFRKGNLVFRDVPVMKLTTPSPVERFGAVGLLGSDLLVNSIVTIDHKKRTVTITSAEQPVAIDSLYMVPFAEEQGACPVISFRIGERAVNVLFDSGAYGFLSLKETDYRDLYSWKATKIFERGVGTGPSGVSGQFLPRVEKKRIQVAPIVLGAATFNGVITEELTTARHTLLGMRVLEYGKVTIDYSRRQFFFEPHERESDVKLEYYDIAFHLQGEGLTVGCVWGELRKSMKLGDKLVAINGKAMDQFDAKELLIKGIPEVTGRERNELTIMTREGEKKVMYENVDY